MIISTVLDLPKVVPDDWAKWWDIWESNKATLLRKKNTHNDLGHHIGMDVFKSKHFTPLYEAPWCDLRSEYTSLFEQVMLLPVDIYCVRFIQSLADFPPHVDNLLSTWSVRNMFYCADPKPQWFYLSKKSTDIRSAVALELPKESNWWAYCDGEVQHATKYSPTYPKIIIQYFVRAESVKEYVLTQLDSYPEYNITL